jgi:glyoxylase-like metal-dependent hydrolase (beta-lactamase superfamily II)
MLLNFDIGEIVMSLIDRRNFVKSISVGVGAAALAGTNPAMAEEKKTSAGTKTPYEVFALKYAGPFDRKLAMTLFNTEDMAINYYIWAIRAKDGETTLVDTGTGKVWGPKFKGFVPPEQLVARLGIKPEQVTRIVITHMHFDHVGGGAEFAQLYPAAKFYVQKKEFDFWVNSPLSQRAAFKSLRNPDAINAFAELAQGPRVMQVDGDKVIGPDMQLLLAPGHTPGLQGVLIPTAKGQTIVGSDSAHLFRSFKEDVPSGLITDLPIWLETFDKLRSSAPIENIFPGHDAKMLTDYPQVAENVTQLA